MSLRDRVGRLEDAAERPDAPAPEEYRAAHARHVIRLRAKWAYELADPEGRLLSEKDFELEKDFEFLANDSEERAAEDLAVIERWRAVSDVDLRAEADAARAKLLSMR